jgi:signal transduction histidine kinase
MTQVVHQRQPAVDNDIDTVRALCHDLRQPLSAIMLLAGCAGGDVDRRLAMITEQAAWVAELLTTVLTDAAEDETVQADITLLARQAVARVTPTARCSLTVKASPPAEAWVRPVALSRALGCLLDNAIRAAGDDGHVVVTVEGGVDEVHIAVADDGPGLGKIASVTSLGLTTTRAMVAACRGRFELRQGPVRGVVAEIALPSAVTRMRA